MEQSVNVGDGLPLLVGCGCVRVVDLIVLALELVMSVSAEAVIQVCGLPRRGAA
jgi:hypothetical protein